MVPQDPGQPNTPIVDLELQRISQSYGEVGVLNALSLEVFKGELCCLLGPSGCGKTTTLKIVAGFLEPDAGIVRLAGADITHRPAQKRNVGMVFQNYALFPHMNVYDNVAYGLRRRKLPETHTNEKVREMLNLVQLAGFELRRIHELSGGQQQRIALARALVIEPDLLLLDEPLSNLDARLRSDMREEIRRIQRTLRITTLYVTHDQEEAMSIADRIVVMNRGNIEQIGSPREIYEQPASHFVADFVGRLNVIRRPVVDGNVSLLGRQLPVCAETPHAICAIRPERIRMGPAAGSAIAGEVEHAVYIGATVRYRVKYPEADGSWNQLNVEVSGPDATYRVGDQVALDVRNGDVHVFPAEA